MLIKLSRFKPALIGLFFSLLAVTAYAAGDDELLMPDEAFRFNAEITEPGIIEASWKIADGYYLYQKKFKFDTESNVSLADAQFPKGIIINDQFFGEIETYRDEVTVKVPYSGNDAAATMLSLKTVYQGCADLGVCYPPQHKKTELKLAQAAPAAAPLMSSSEPKSNSALGILSGLNDSLGGSEDELLDPDKAFAFRADLTKPGVIVADWMVADGYYLYKKKIKMGLEGATGLKLGAGKFPPSTRMEDPTFGDVDIFRGPIQVEFPILGANAPPSQLSLKAQFQGCADIGVCYPPIDKTIKFDASTLANLIIPGANAAEAEAPAESTTTEAADSGKVSEQDAIAAKLASGNTPLTLLSFFGFGLLLAFTPCVFPMIPILSGIIVGHGKQTSTSKALMLSIAYVLAMALTYTVVGVLAGLFGANLQIWFQNPWVLSIFAIIFIALSFSMFGFYELQMPASVQSKLTSISNTQEGGKLASAAIMGFLSALIVGPCVTAPLIGALIYIGQTGDAVLGGMALFSLSMGMGAPLLVIGASAGKLLPRAGSWMDAVKAVFGVMLLGVAIWLMERVLPAPIIMILWALLLIVSGVYMGALQPVAEGKSRWHFLWKGVGFAILLYGSLLLIGAAANTNNVMQPLKGMGGGFNASGEAVEEGLPFEHIKSLEDLETAISKANSRGQTVMLDFYADWCISCKEMEAFTFVDADVKAAFKNTVTLQADVTANDEIDQVLLKQFGIIGPPAILYFDKQGQERKGYRAVGFMPAEKFAAHSRDALK